MASFSISKEQAMEFKARADRLMNKARAVSEKSEEAVGQVIRTMEVGGAAFTAGVLKGRFGTVEVMGIPADLGAAVAIHGLGFVGGGKYKEHLHSIGDGVLASYLTAVGAGIGDRMAREGAAALTSAASSTPARVSGGSESGHELSSGGERLSDQELQVLQQAGLRS